MQSPRSNGKNTKRSSSINVNDLEFTKDQNKLNVPRASYMSAEMMNSRKSSFITFNNADHINEFMPLSPGSNNNKNKTASSGISPFIKIYTDKKIKEQEEEY